MKVRLKRGWSKAWPELTLGNVYRVLGISNAYFRLISDAGDPILFNRNAFELVDPVQPSDWISEHGEEGELYAAPRTSSTADSKRPGPTSFGSQTSRTS